MKTRVVLAIFGGTLALVCQGFAADKPSSPAASTNKPAAVTAAPAAAKGDEVVARVNGNEIKRKELDDATQAFAMQMARRGRPLAPAQRPLLEHDVLEELIGRELLLEAGRKSIPADIDKKVSEQLDQTAAGVGGMEQFNKTLADNGLTIDEYKTQVRNNIIVRDTIQSAVEKQAVVTTNDAKAFYDSNLEQFKQPEMVHASHILIRVPQDATAEVKKQKRAQIDAARALIKGGEKFADVAKKVSEDPGSAVNGGDLGFFGHGQMVPEFDAAAFSLKTNEVSDVITTQFGYHILIVTGHKPAQTMPFAEVTGDLIQYLKQRKSAELTRDYVASLRKAGKVEVLLPPPPAAAGMPGVETAPVQAPAK